MSEQDRLDEQLSDLLSKGSVPASGGELDPLLAIAKRLHHIGAIPPSAAAVQRTRLALVRASVPQVRASRPWWPKLATAMPLAIVLVVIGSLTALAAAPSALPDSPLYGVRNLREAMEIRLAATAAQRAALDVRFAQQRAEQLARVTRATGASPSVVSTLLRDINSRVDAADTEAHDEGADDRAAVKRVDEQIETELTQIHDSETLPPDATQQLDSTIQNVQSSESLHAAEPAPAPEPAPSSDALNPPASGTDPAPTAEATPSADATASPANATASPGTGTP